MQNPWDEIVAKAPLAMTVSQCIEYINFVITQKQVFIEGEIVSYNVSQNKWVFFDLKDEQSRVGCFAVLYNLDCRLEDGMKVRVTGTPRLHQKSGKFSIYVDRVELCGEGALKKAFELTKAKLKEEGLFAPERKRQIPQMPEVIGLIASRESAAYTDFMRILNQRWGGVTIYLAHVAVQGESAVEEIVGAFEYFNQSDVPVEAIVLTRGGGSMEDLQAFNSERVVRAVFGSKHPVICGVGHERDETLADYAADLRAATPTHAATLLVPDREDFARRLERSVYSLGSIMDSALEWERHRVERACAALYHRLTERTNGFQVLLKRFYFQASRIGESAVTQRARIGEMSYRMGRTLEHRRSEMVSHREFLERSLQQMSPYGVLKRGYSIVKKQGKAVSKAADLKPGDLLDIILSDTKVVAKVQGPQKDLFSS